MFCLESVKLIKQLGGGPDLKQLTWNFLNDSLHSDACLYFTVSVILSFVALFERCLRPMK